MYQFDRFDLGVPKPVPLIFEPHVFFWKPWRGDGEVRGPTGKVLRRFKVTGFGRAVGDQAVMRQTVVFDDGETHEKGWEILSTDRDRYTARDIDNGIVAEGGQAPGGRFAWSFSSKISTPIGPQSVKSVVTYEMAGKTTARSVCVNKLWGWLVVSQVTVFYSHED